ncbi:MAG: trypsin-like peptidase domain-containing protein [Pirellulaceae bacterium]
MTMHTRSASLWKSRKLGRLALWSLALGAALPLQVSGKFASAGELSPQRNTRTVQAIRTAEPAVVNIEGNKPASSVTGASSDRQQVNGMGAGVIIDSRGFILTNQHVIQDVGRIEVTLSSGRQYVGRLIARHAETDLALVKIDAGRQLPVIECGTSSDLMRGEPVIAIGNPFGYHHTVTEGIISALHRDIPVNGVEDYPDLIQTDASINPGNSGGPLLNVHGNMIGINAAVRIGAQGIGFAIPVDKALDVAADMIARYRRSVGTESLNVRTKYNDGDSQLVVLSSRKDDIRRGDVITKIDDRTVANRLDFELAMVGRRPGSKLSVEIERSGESLVASMPLTRGSSQPKVKLASTGSLSKTVYSTLGVQLEAANPRAVSSVDSSYKGGLVVRSVRNGGPADRAQIRTGDILVGLLEWQTPNWEDLDWVMKSSEMRTASTPKFHIIRGNDVFWGNMEVR